MSWSLSATGHRAAVAKVIDEQANNSPQNENTQQKQRAAKLIALELACLPNVPFVRVEASGHFHGGLGNMRIEITPAQIVLDEIVFDHRQHTQAPTESASSAPATTVPIAEAPGVIAPEVCSDCGQVEHSRGCAKY